MAARIAGAIVALISAGFLAWVIYISFGPEAVVTPTAKVTHAQSSQAGGQANPAAVPDKTLPLTGAEQGASTTGAPASGASGAPSVQDILAARTELMRDRTKTGTEAFPALAAGDFQINTGTPASGNPGDVQRWLADKPGGDLLKDRGRIVGDSSLPYKNAASFEQEQGRDWRRFHNDQVRYGGGWLIFGSIFALAFFLVIRGRVEVVEGFSGQKVLRFGGIERANHWMTATSFVLMGLTGLIILYGKPLLIPLIGEPNLGPVASWSAWLHMAFAVPFVLGILIMIGMWATENLPTMVDWIWLKQGGGMVIPGKHPPAYKFNAGQKLLFWIQTLGGLALLASGLTLMFPFYWFGYTGMQIAQIFHAALALSMIAVIIAHAYIGTIGMEGAFDAMWEGTVDKNWAKEHHSLWFERITGRKARPIEEHPHAEPAE